MKLKKILNESDASDEAKKKGLTSIGWGRWADKTGKEVAKTVNGKLVFRRTMSFAKKAHGNQKYGDKPYSYHLKKVHDIAKQYGGNKTERIAAVLHDTIEDTSVVKEKIEKKFGPRIAHIVDLLSNRPSKKETFERIRTDPEAVFVKLCDRLANVSEGSKNEKYRKEMALFKSILYRPGEYDELWKAIEKQLAKKI